MQDMKFYDVRPVLISAKDGCPAGALHHSVVEYRCDVCQRDRVTIAEGFKILYAFSMPLARHSDILTYYLLVF